MPITLPQLHHHFQWAHVIWSLPYSGVHCPDRTLCSSIKLQKNTSVQLPKRPVAALVFCKMTLFLLLQDDPNKSAGWIPALLATTPFEVEPGGRSPGLCSAPCGNDSTGTKHCATPYLAANPSQEACYTQKWKGFKGFSAMDMWFCVEPCEPSGWDLKLLLHNKTQCGFDISFIYSFISILITIKIAKNNLVPVNIYIFPCCFVFPYETWFWHKIQHQETLF